MAVPFRVDIDDCCSEIVPLRADERYGFPLAGHLARLFVLVLCCYLGEWGREAHY